MSLPLDGLTVVSLEQAVAAPLASRQLADLGARVIKVERPDGGDFARSYDKTVRGLSSVFVWLNRSKESLVLDLKHERATDVLEPLLSRADVFIQNLAPGATGRLGLGAAALAERHPNLIVCDISGYGDSGVYAGRKAYDLMIQAEVGFLSITGHQDAPAKAGISVADIAAGMYAFSGILTALLERQMTSIARHVPIALIDCLGEWMGHAIYFSHYGGDEPARLGTMHATVAPYGTFRTAEGTEVVLAVQNQREWTRFCELVLEREDLVCDPRFIDNSARIANKPQLKQLIEERIGRWSTAEAIDRLNDAGIANAGVNGVRDYVDHPVNRDRDRWTTIESAVGELAALLPPGVPDGLFARMGPIPALGEHTETVLRWLEFTTEDIAALRESGAI